MIWLTADLHFWHSRMIKHAERPFKTAEEMNEVLIKNWNEVVQDGDLVYILGDVSWAGSKKTKEVVTRLKGDKILIKGNHDSGTKKWLDMGFLEVIDSCFCVIDGEQVNLSHYPYYPSFFNRLYVSVKEKMKELCGIRIAHAQKKTLDKRLKDDGKWLLHGHVHKCWKFKGKMINVGVDVWDYRPVSLETIQEIISGS